MKKVEVICNESAMVASNESLPHVVIRSSLFRPLSTCSWRRSLARISMLGIESSKILRLMALPHRGGLHIRQREDGRRGDIDIP